MFFIIFIIFLQCGNFLHSKTINYFTYCSKSLIKLLAKVTAERLFYEFENIVENIEQNTNSEPRVLTLNEMLKTIDSVMVISLSQEGKVPTLKKEFKVI